MSNTVVNPPNGLSTYRIIPCMPGRHVHSIAGMVGPPPDVDAGSVRSDAIVERVRELGVLTACLRDVRAGSARVVVISGIAGIGKTALLEAARVRAEADGVRVLWARAPHLATDTPYGLLRRLLGPFVARNGGPDSLTGAAAFAAPLFTPGASLAAGVDYGCQWLLASLADEGPTLVAIDDGHWADAESLRVLADAAEDLQRAPLAIMVTTRPSAEAAAQPLLAQLATLDSARVLDLGPLTEPGMTAVVREAFGQEPDPSFVRACAQASGGNVFYLRELVRPLVAAGRPPSAATASELGTTGQDALVWTLRSRLGQLGDMAGEVARAAAVMGDDTPLRDVAALAAIDLRRAGQEALRLTGAAVLARPDPASFPHPLVRAAVEQTVDPGGLDDLHARAARILLEAGAPAAQVAQHLLLASPIGSAAVAELLATEGRNDLMSGSATTALRLLRRAMAEPPSPSLRPSVLLSLAEAERAAGEPSRAAENLSEVIETGSRELALSAMADLYEVFYDIDDREGARRLDEQALAAEPYGDAPAEMRLRAKLLVRHANGLVLQAPPALFDLDIDNMPIDSGEHRRLLACAAIQRRSAGACTAEQFVAYMRRSVQDMPADRPLTYWEVLAVLESAAFLASVEAMADADAVLDRLRPDVARLRGIAPDLQAEWTHRTVLNTLRCGRFEEAEARLAEAEEFAARHGLTVYTQLAFYARGSIELERGNYAEAGRLLLRGPVEGDVGALAELLSGRPEEALKRLDLPTDPDAPVGEWEIQFAPHQVASHAWELLGDRDAARREADRELAIRRQHGPSFRLAMALRRQASFVPAREAVALLDEAVSACADTPRMPVLARVRAARGAALRRAGRLREARAELVTALDLAGRSGMTRLTEQLTEEVRAAGGRPRRTRVTGAGSLTEGQAAVARLAGAGATNRQIAEQLYVTVKTVETHLAAVYRKLEVPGREHLAAALAGVP
jgi:DNA-binding CsgD family transcriptional regulator